MTFVEPATIEEAERRREEVASRVALIQTQFVDQNRLDPETGERMSAEKYWEWKHRAVGALFANQNELRRLKTWIKAYNRKNFTEPMNQRQELVEVARSARRLVDQYDTPTVDDALADLSEALDELERKGFRFEPTAARA